MIEKCLGVVVSVNEVASSLENVRVWEDKIQILCLFNFVVPHASIDI